MATTINTDFAARYADTDRFDPSVVDRCELCNGTGWVEDEDARYVAECPECTPEPEPPVPAAAGLPAIDPDVTYRVIRRGRTIGGHIVPGCLGEAHFRELRDHFARFYRVPVSEIAVEVYEKPQPTTAILLGLARLAA